jgi:predicted nucleic acid-binding Zn ribbon protein
MKPSADFYREMPKKECSVCGNEIEEQHEMYVTECFDCQELQEHNDITA